MVDHHFDLLCRLCTFVCCGQGAGVLIDRQICLKIESCLPFKVDEMDKLPKLICADCLYKLESFYGFRKQCLDSEIYLNDLIKEPTNDSPMYLISQYDNSSFSNINLQDMNSVSNDVLHLNENHTVHLLEDNANAQQAFTESDFEVTNFTHHSHKLDFDNTNTDSLQLALNECTKAIQILPSTGDENHDDDVDFDDNDYILGEVFHDKDDDFVENVLEEVRIEEQQQQQEEAVVRIEVQHLLPTVDVQDGDATDVDAVFSDGMILMEDDGPDMEEISGGNGNYDVAETKRKCDVSLGANAQKKFSVFCEICQKGFLNNFRLKMHMTSHSQDKPFQCTFDGCAKKFKSKLGLTEHEAKHTGKYDLSCPICGKGFQNKSYLECHKRIHSDSREFKCSLCGISLKSKAALADHENRHLDIRPFVCSRCDKRFTTRSTLEIHETTHTKSSEKAIYPCSVCDKKFSSKYYLSTHYRIHTNDRNFICNCCGKAFLTKTDLQLHSGVHTGEKPYVCEICGKNFSRKNNLALHRRVHTGERPYACKYCDQAFAQMTPMIIHTRTHTGERPFACKMCPKTFLSKHFLIWHMKKKGHKPK